MLACFVAQALHSYIDLQGGSVSKMVMKQMAEYGKVYTVRVCVSNEEKNGVPFGPSVGLPHLIIN